MFVLPPCRAMPALFFAAAFIAADAYSRDMLVSFWWRVATRTMLYAAVIMRAYAHASRHRASARRYAIYALRLRLCRWCFLCRWWRYADDDICYAASVLYSALRARARCEPARYYDIAYATALLFDASRCRHADAYAAIDIFHFAMPDFASVYYFFLMFDALLSLCFRHTICPRAPHAAFSDVSFHICWCFALFHARYCCCYAAILCCCHTRYLFYAECHYALAHYFWARLRDATLYAHITLCSMLFPRFDWYFARCLLLIICLLFSLVTLFDCCRAPLIFAILPTLLALFVCWYFSLLILLILFTYLLFAAAMPPIFHARRCFFMLLTAARRCSFSMPPLFRVIFRFICRAAARFERFALSRLMPR